MIENLPENTSRRGESIADQVAVLFFWFEENCQDASHTGSEGMASDHQLVVLMLIDQFVQYLVLVQNIKDLRGCQIHTLYTWNRKLLTWNSLKVTITTRRYYLYKLSLKVSFYSAYDTLVVVTTITQF